MQSIDDCYRILDLPPGASIQDVKDAYKTLVQFWHPDRFQHNPRLRAKAEEKMKELNFAYRTLCDYLEKGQTTRGYYSPPPRQPEPESAGQSGSRGDTSSAPGTESAGEPKETPSPPAGPGNAAGRPLREDWLTAPIAGFWPRAGAWAIDLALYYIAELALIVFPVLLVAVFSPNANVSGFVRVFSDYSSLLGFLLLACYHAVWLGFLSTSPGKIAFGLVVVDSHSRKRIGFARGLLRSLSYFVSSLLFGLGFLSVAWDKKHQAWHDGIASTLVVRRRKQGAAAPFFAIVAAIACAALIAYGQTPLLGGSAQSGSVGAGRSGVAQAPNVTATEYRAPRLPDLAPQRAVRYVQDDGVDMRESPSLDSRVVTTCRKNDCVVIGRQKGGWVNIVTQDGSQSLGWMRDDLLGLYPVSVPVPGIAQNSLPLTEKYVQNDNAHLRGGPGLQYPVVSHYATGDKLLVKGSNGDWDEIVNPADHAATLGWMHNSQLELEPRKGGWKYIQGNDTNVRSGPGFQYEKVGKYQANDRVLVGTVEGNWDQVIEEDGDAVYGWVYNVLIAPKPVPDAAIHQPGAPAPIETGPTYWTLGSSQELVRKLQGTPAEVSFYTWHYGRDSVSFSYEGKVTGYDNPSGSLNVRLTSTSHATTFAIGSTKDEVIAAQGTPTRVLGGAWSTWSYGSDSVNFSHSDGTVSGFDNRSGRLHVR